MPQNHFGGVTEQLAQTYTPACTALAKQLEPMFQMGFMGIFLKPFMKFVLNVIITVENLPKTLYRSKFGSVLTKLRPGIDTV
jgi:hypothetical protein